MKKYPYTLLALIFISLIALIAIPGICVKGAQNGILLWFNTVVPTLFPFFVVTRLIIELDICPDRLMPFYPVFTGMLSGYPAGAMNISEMVKRKTLSRENGQILMIFCNNASPVFMISYVSYYCLKDTAGRYIIWLSVIPASIITAFIINILYRLLYKKDRLFSYNQTNKIPAAYNRAGNISLYSLFEQVVMKSCEVLLMIGAYIIIFSIAANIIQLLPLPDYFSILISGLLEITTGVNLLGSAGAAFSAKTGCVLAAIMCGFGGISALLQTKSAIKGSGLSISVYFIHKIICAILSGIICYFILTGYLSS